MADQTREFCSCFRPKRRERALETLNKERGMPENTAVQEAARRSRQGQAALRRGSLGGKALCLFDDARAGRRVPVHRERVNTRG